MRRVSWKRAIVAYLAITGVAAHVAGAAGVHWALGYFDLEPREAIHRAAERLGVPEPLRESRLLRPPERFPGHVLDGRIVEDRPRIVLPALRGWNGEGVPGLLEDRLRAYADPVDPRAPCRGGSLGPLTACWLVTGQREVGRRALAEARAFQLVPPEASGEYGNAWLLAWAVDLLHLHPDFTEVDARGFSARLEEALHQYLQVLDGGSASLWHGRAVLAARAWVIAVALGTGSPERADLVRRAQSHSVDVMRALALTEAWPEGYNYWINTRAFDLMLALAAWRNGVEDSALSDSATALMRRVGRWHIHATRPDGRIQGYGDEGPRVDLKDETRRVIDLIAQETRDPVLATYSEYLAELHGAASYWHGYQWWFPLLNDPSVKSLPRAARGTLRTLEGLLPLAEVFGRDAMGMVYLRSGWGPEDTFVSFRAGHSFTHHGHADAGHFTLFKGAPLATSGGTYRSVATPHRLYYAMRTVAKNSLLVMRPGERVGGGPLMTRDVADGGQRLPIPTGSAISSVADWRRHLGDGKHLEGGRIDAFEHEPGVYSFVEADLTAAYNRPEHDAGGRGGKVHRVLRRLLYLHGADRLVVLDDVLPTDPAYRPKWLLHTLERPEVEGQLRVLRGTPRDGILSTDRRRAFVTAGEGRLTLDVLAPAPAEMRLVGGPEHRFYVEADGDDADLDGESFAEGADLRSWFEAATWRIEVQPREASPDVRFVTVLSPALGAHRRDTVAALPATPGGCGAYRLDAMFMLLCDRGAAGTQELDLPSWAGELLVIGFPGSGRVELVAAQSGAVVARAPGARVVHFDVRRLEPGPVTVSWRPPTGRAGEVDPLPAR